MHDILRMGGVVVFSWGPVREEVGGALVDVAQREVQGLVATYRVYNYRIGALELLFISRSLIPKSIYC